MKLATISSPLRLTGNRAGRWLSLLTLLALVGALILSAAQITPAAAQDDVPPQESATAITWKVETLLDPPLFKNMTDRSLRFDKTGTTPGLAFGGDHLYYATLRQGQWVVTMVDSSPSVGKFASLDYDMQGRPRIAYYDEIRESLKFAWFDGVGWNLKEIDRINPPLAAIPPEEQSEPSAAPARLEVAPETAHEFSHLTGSVAAVAAPKLRGVGMYASLAVGRNNQIHISYYDAENGDLKYATTLDGEIWYVNAIDARNDNGSFTSIAVDSQNNPHISYMTEQYDAVKYAYFDGKQWGFETVDDNSVGPYTSLVLDSNDRPHISYYNFVGKDLKYAFRKGANNWDVQTIDATGDVGLYTSIAIINGKVCISYFEQTGENLKLACAGNWNTETVVSTGSVGWYTSLAVDKAEVLHIAALDATTGEYKYYTPGRPWNVSVIARTDNVGISPSLDIDNQGIIAISHMSDMREDLMLFRPQGLNFDVVSGRESVGLYSSLKFDRQGNPNIAFYDASRGNLVYASYVNYRWYFETVDQFFDVGKYVSLALDSNDRPHISYYDATNGDLLYAYHPGDRWYVTQVDTDRDTGQYTSLALTPNNLPRIAYYAAWSGDLWYAEQTALGVWTKDLVDQEGDVGQHVDLTLDSQNRPHMAYFDATNQHLRYAYRSNNNPLTWTWAKVVVEPGAPDVGTYPSIAIDPNSNDPMIQDWPVIAYYDSNRGDLKYATWNGINWTSEIVDGVGNVGLFPDLMFVPTGLPPVNADGKTTPQANRPMIAYYDYTNGNLKLAWVSGAGVALPPFLRGYVARLPIVAR